MREQHTDQTTRGNPDMSSTKATLRPSKTPEEHTGYYGIEPVKAEAGTGGLIPVKETMKMPTKLPCRECPGRRDSAAGFLGGYTPEMYLELLYGPASVACHCSKGFQTGEISKQRHCTGVVALRANWGIRTGTAADRAIEALIADYPRDLKQDFFADPLEFYAYHKAAQIAAMQYETSEVPNYPTDWGHSENDIATGEHDADQ